MRSKGGSNKEKRTESDRCRPKTKNFPSQNFDPIYRGQFLTELHNSGCILTARISSFEWCISANKIAHLRAWVHFWWMCSSCLMLELRIERTLSGGGGGVGKALKARLKRGSNEEIRTRTDLSRAKTRIYRPKTSGKHRWNSTGWNLLILGGLCCWKLAE